ncbi:unnamed protein product [Acanthoscelides obtectus]|uniref:Uncharacterized protein n=1 Tax=Acanthoscelides obtectus TaxID=200917 RepID=A0A9P0JIM0_ACAOB|nr:unnamed protein product [Acanthoscelides obtectus]CAK1639649.1 hypothetical protein AOBTE_LOCUS11293 [Acanthoscelides obtectus]
MKEHNEKTKMCLYVIGVSIVNSQTGAVDTARSLLCLPSSNGCTCTLPVLLTGGNKRKGSVATPLHLFGKAHHTMVLKVTLGTREA